MKPKTIQRTPLSLKIQWQDSVEEFVDYIWLRSHCTCAVCRERKGPLPQGIALQKMTQLQSMDLVGNYALGLMWADGHRSMFSFELLKNHLEHRSIPPVNLEARA